MTISYVYESNKINVNGIGRINMRKFAPWFFITALVVAIGMIFYLNSASPDLIKNGKIVDPAQTVDNFQLTDVNGQTVTNDIFQGKWSLVSFGFTSCPDICPTTLSFFMQEMKLITNDLSNTQFIFVSVDPERDTLDKIKSWVEYFHKDIVGLTGTEKQLIRFSRMFGAWFEPEKVPGSEEYTVNHPPYIYLVNPEGQWQAYYGPPLKKGKIADDLNRLMTPAAGSH